MRYRLRTLLILLAIGPPMLASSLAQTKNEPGEALYGEWEVVEMVYLTKDQDFKGGNGGWFSFEPGGFRRTLGEEHRQTLMQNKRLREFLTSRCVVGARELDIWTKFPWRDEKHLKAIYELRDGTLRIIWPNDYGERPTDFDEAYKNRSLTLFVLKKVK